MLAMATPTPSANAFVWQGAFFSNTSAMADPTATLIASSDAGDRSQQKASRDAGRTKNFIEDTADKVKYIAMVRHKIAIANKISCC
jgi:ApbE superfamily uncharacterized protein (UPF0280 family)